MRNLFVEQVLEGPAKDMQTAICKGSFDPVDAVIEDRRSERRNREGKGQLPKKRWKPGHGYQLNVTYLKHCGEIDIVEIIGLFPDGSKTCFFRAGEKEGDVTLPSGEMMFYLDPSRLGEIYKLLDEIVDRAVYRRLVSSGNGDIFTKDHEAKLEAAIQENLAAGGFFELNLEDFLDDDDEENPPVGGISR